MGSNATIIDTPTMLLPIPRANKGKHAFDKKHMLIEFPRIVNKFSTKHSGMNTATNLTKIEIPRSPRITAHQLGKLLWIVSNPNHDTVETFSRLQL